MRYLSLLLIFLFCSCAKDSNAVKSLKGEALGTTYSIQYFSDSDQVTSKEIDSILKVINTSMSTYIKNSDISKINDGDRSIQVDEHFRTVFLASKSIYQKTDGYFDPSVGLLVNAYGFGPEGYVEDVTETEIDSIYNLVGFDKIELTNQNKIESSNQDLYLDFNAIAKGYTVDVFGNFLSSKGLKNYLVEIGGEVKVKGKNKERNGSWKVGIELPEEDSRRELAYGLELQDQSLATSGNYRKFRMDSVTGLKYVHTINPRTGKSQKTDLLSASVVAEDCATADAYATAFMAMGIKKSKAFLENNDEKLQVVLIYIDEDNKQQTFISESLEDFIEAF
jgi:thiamine biosynthesis lipoprotein